jgi:hypothetical protein
LATSRIDTSRHVTSLDRAFIWRQLGWATLTGLIALVAAVIALGITPDSLSMRWQSGTADDQTLHYMVSTVAGDSPFFLPNDRMGFPSTQNLFFAPQYDPISAVVLTVFGFLLKDGVTALNVYQVLSFFTVGFTSYLFFRALRVRTAVAVAFGLVLALAPFHFQRVGFGHAFVSNYWAVPLVGILLLMIAGPSTNPMTPWIDTAPTKRSRLLRRLVPIVVLTLLVSLSLSYYFVFAAILMGGVLIAVAVRSLLAGEGWKPLLWPAVTTGLLVVFVGVQLAILSLDFNDRYQNYFAGRTAAQSELHGGRITTLLLPWAGSLLPLFGRWGREYNLQTTVSIYAEPPGTPFLAAGAMVLMIAFIVIRLLAAPPVQSRYHLGRFLDDPRARLMAASFFWGLLFYAVAAFGVIFAFVISPELRAWVRMGIFLIVFALGFLAVLVDTVLTRRLVRALALTAVLAIVLVDQLWGVRTAVDLQPTPDTAIRAYVADAEQALDPDCGVVQLPLKGFPETGPIGAMPDYNEALPYILATDNTLRWSYGAVRGSKSGDFWEGIETPGDFAAAVRESGACAIQVDQLAYVDVPDGWRAFVDSVADAADPTLRSTDEGERFLLFEVSR